MLTMFNLSQDEIFSTEVIPNLYPPYILQWCTTINWPNGFGDSYVCILTNQISADFELQFLLGTYFCEYIWSIPNLSGVSQ